MDAVNHARDGADPQPLDAEAVLHAASAAIPPPAWDTASTVAFAVDLIDAGRFAVGAIHPETEACHGRTFTLPAEQAALGAWIEEHQGTHNLHFALNEPVPREQQQGQAGRIKHSDLATLRGVVVDIDPRKDIEAEPGGLARERDRLRAVAETMITDPNGPSAIIDSGSGLQAVFLFREPLPATDENKAAVKAQSKALARLYGGDATNDVVHLFRLPWTVNLPNAAKRTRGRKPAATKGKVLDPRRLHTLDGLAALAPPIDPEPADTAAAPPFEMALAWEVYGRPEALPVDLAERVTLARSKHPGLDRILSADPPETGSRMRSAHDFAIACACLEAGLSDRAEVAAVVVAYSPVKFEDEDDRRGRERAERYLALTVDSACARVARAGPTRFFTPIDDPDDPAAQAPEAAVEPIDIFGDDDPGDTSTPPDGSLPDVVAPFVRATAAQMGVPESFVAASAVAALAGAIGNALTLRVMQHSDGYRVSASLAVVVVARPGRKKSPTIGAVLTPHRAIDGELHTASARARATWRAVYCTPKGTPKTGAPQPPPERQILVDDATVEKQVRVHADNPTGIIRAPDELSAFLGSMGAYKRNGDGDRGMLLKMLDGGPVSLERVGGTVRAERALMGLIASTQPGRIRALARDLGSDGFLQRLIFIMDDGAEREPLDSPADPVAAGDYARAVRGMFEIRNSGGGIVHLSPEARTILDATWLRIRALRALPGASEAWEGHVSKWNGFLYRIALTFHALDTWAFLDTVPAGPGVPVTAETARKASRFALFLVRHALRFYGEYYEPAEHNAEARGLAGYLLARPDVLFVTPREIEKARRSLQGNRRLTLATMGELERFGWVAVAERTAEGPSKWAVNPKVHARFAERAEREKAQRAHAQAQISAALSARRGLNDDL